MHPRRWSFRFWMPAVVLCGLSGCSDQADPVAVTDPPRPVFDISASLDSQEETQSPEGYDTEMTGYVCPQSIFGGWRITISGPWGTKSFGIIASGTRVSWVSTGVPPKALYSLPGAFVSTDGNVRITVLLNQV